MILTVMQNSRKKVKQKLTEGKVAPDFLPIKGETRNCIVILRESSQTRVVESDPELSRKEVRIYLERSKTLAGNVRISEVS